MKRTQRLHLIALLVLSMASHTAFSQNVDEERMKRDIKVAENVLATLIKQELEQQGAILGLNISGTYEPGYGVTFRVPSESSMPFTIINMNQVPGEMVSDGAYRYSLRMNGDTYRYSLRMDGVPDAPAPPDGVVSLSERVKASAESSADSVRSAYNTTVIRAAQNFILDYGEFLSQLRPDERIVVTNQSDRMHFIFAEGKRSRILVEGSRGDVAAFRQGKLTRDQALKKLRVVNTEIIDARQPDLEMLSSILTRLYRPDLSKTYFAEGNVYYERLRDIGVVYYMRLVSSNEVGPNRFLMPTVGHDQMDLETRNRKVTELYPVFEQELIDNILDYGRTVKSLANDEDLVFNIVLTRCSGCGIPDTIELSIDASILQDLNAGKIDKNTAFKKVTIKKGQRQ